MDYKKIFQTDKSKPVYHFSPNQQVPLLCCPECSSIKASMCSDCGTFMCTNIHKRTQTGPWADDEPSRYYYYDNKKGQVKEGHDPTCQKQTSAEEIAKRVVELLGKNEDKSLGKVTDFIVPTQKDYSPIVPASLSSRSMDDLGKLRVGLKSMITVG